jgi:AcrR family transcriptional regulator
MIVTNLHNLQMPERVHSIQSRIYMDKETSQRIKIAEAAAARYPENRRFTIQALAADLKMKPETIYSLFPNRSSILRYFYTSRMVLYREQISGIEGYETFTLSEKLSNLFLTLLDLFGDHREFVLLTYKEFVACSLRKTGFEEELKKELELIFSADTRISSSSKPFLNRFAWHSVWLQFHGLIAFWNQDESRNTENSMALVDKWSSLCEEVFYSKVLDKGFDLARFLFYNSPFSRCMMDTGREESTAV